MKPLHGEETSNFTERETYQYQMLTGGSLDLVSLHQTLLQGNLAMPLVRLESKSRLLIMSPLLAALTWAGRGLLGFFPF